MEADGNSLYKFDVIHKHFLEVCAKVLGLIFFTFVLVYTA